MTLREFKRLVKEVPSRFDNLEVFIGSQPQSIKVKDIKPVADLYDPEPIGPTDQFETYNYPTYILIT